MRTLDKLEPAPGRSKLARLAIALSVGLLVASSLAPAAFAQITSTPNIVYILMERIGKMAADFA